MRNRVDQYLQWGCVSWCLVTVAEDDIGQLCACVAAAVARQTVERLAGEGFHDARLTHSSVFAGLVAGDRTVTQLAGRLGISPQAVSKTVAELERSGYLRKVRDGADARARRLEISERGQELVAATRRVRSAVSRDIARWLGARRHRVDSAAPRTGRAVPGNRLRGLAAPGGARAHCEGPSGSQVPDPLGGPRHDELALVGREPTELLLDDRV